MTVTLRPYQQHAVEWLKARKCALLALEMGCGKTPVSIAAADSIGAKKLLVICPAVARINWARELKKFGTINRDICVVESIKDAPLPHQTVITSFETAVRRLDGAWKAWGFDALIVDEAHFAKSVDAKRSKAIFGRDGVAHRCGRIWALSGTPAPNARADELYIILRAFGRTTLTYDDFVRRYCTYIHQGPYQRIQVTGTKPSMVPELKELLKPIMLRRLKRDVIKEMPPVQYGTLPVVPDDKIDFAEHESLRRYLTMEGKIKHAELIARQREVVMEVLGKNLSPDEGMSMLEVLAQSVSTLRVYSGLQAVRPVIDAISEELEMGLYKKIVLFAVTVDVVRALARGLSAFNPLTLHGQTPPAERQANIDRFQSDPSHRVFIGNIRACGTAVTLTAASNAVLVEQDWNPAANEQAIGRLHRIGQTEPVFVRSVELLGNGVYSRIADLLSKKQAMSEQIFDMDSLP